MNNYLDKARQWAPTIVVVLIALFAIVRMQTTTAALCKQVETKLSKEVYQAEKDNLVRELDMIHETLQRFERKFDNAFTGKPGG